MEKVVIVGMKRSPFTKFNGALSLLPLKEIASQTLKGLLDELKVPITIDKVILGQVMGAGHGQNIARYASIKSGLPQETTAMTVNEVCGSGMMALQIASQMIRLKEASCIIAGGLDSFSQTPERIDRFSDGLTDDFSGEKMGVTAEQVANQFHITRKEQDEFAFLSQKKATKHKALSEQDIVPIHTKDGIVQHDECVRSHTTIEKLASLSPVFAQNGSVTAGNSSALSDGVALMALMAESKAKALNLPILATIDAFAEVGIAPEIMGIAPVKAIQQLLNKTSSTIADIDYFEINEAFASQSVAVKKELHIPEEKLNPWGGAIALGHPLGASGTRIVMQLVRILEKNNKHTGIASLCIGGGMGMALKISR